MDRLNKQIYGIEQNRIELDRQIDRQNRQNRQNRIEQNRVDRHIDRHIDRQTDRQIDRQILMTDTVDAVD